MNKKDLIQFCKYYQGEKECPYQGTNGVIWDWEKSWVELSVDDDKGAFLLSSFLDEYIFCGMKDFQKYDDIPITLKALAFNRFNQWDEGGDFKEFYKKYFAE